MRVHPPHPYHFVALAPVLYWAVVLLLVMAAICCIALTLRRPRRGLVYAAAGALGVCLLMAALPGPRLPDAAGALIGIAALALAVLGGGPAVQLVLALASRDSVAGAHGGIVVPQAAQDHDVRADASASHEVLRGGTTIGLLERLATAGALMAGFPGALAVLIAIKGVGRFSELNAPEAKERFIIGTLVSLIWASACAGVFLLANR
ncbi:hypothetical protein OSC27_03495 [Microbacterium sp. STN6]|uniref:hypothetical protein n=1 Tax=Microbacterium sp. STN6 TaxID=2995588 RepID=UPI002260948C|nr:hypothetical protein [Microbacterium sp. STN6]MCX7521342.1 hypothetical protein [Microbacterium sp. STN6]